VRPLPLSAIPKHRLDMLLAVEDPGFNRRSGVDFSTPGQGMTSMTQSLVKILYFERFKPGFAKIEQSLIARFVLHPAMSKRDQLEVFINRIGFGRSRRRPILGFADASQSFYGNNLDQISDDQFLSLVAMLMAPRDLDPIKHKAANAERVRRIKRMLAGQCKPSGLKDVQYRNC